MALFTRSSGLDRAISSRDAYATHALSLSTVQAWTRTGPGEKRRAQTATPSNTSARCMKPRAPSSTGLAGLIW